MVGNTDGKEGGVGTESRGSPSPERLVSIQRLLRRFGGPRIFALVILNLALIGFVTALEPAFLNASTFRIIVNNMSLPAVVLPVMVLLLSAGRFDLSVDGVAALAGTIAGILMVDAGWSWPVALLIGLLVGGLIGAVSGSLVEYAGINPFVLTLAIWWIASGAALGLSQGTSPNGFPDAFRTLGATEFPGKLLISIAYAIVASVIWHVIMRHRRFGLHAGSIGGGRDAAVLNGIKAKRIGFILFICSGLFAAFIGLVFAARLNTASSVAFDGVTLEIIAAAVIGGSTIDRGGGSVMGALLGLLFLRIFKTGAVFIGIPAFWQQAMTGIVLFGAIIADTAVAHLEEGEGIRTFPRRLVSLVLGSRR